MSIPANPQKAAHINNNAKQHLTDRVFSCAQIFSMLGAAALLPTGADAAIPQVASKEYVDRIIAPLSAQADWAVTDTSAADYIKNKDIIVNAIKAKGFAVSDRLVYTPGNDGSGTTGILDLNVQYFQDAGGGGGTLLALGPVSGIITMDARMDSTGTFREFISGVRGRNYVDRADVSGLVMNMVNNNGLYSSGLVTMKTIVDASSSSSGMYLDLDLGGFISNTISGMYGGGNAKISENSNGFSWAINGNTGIVTGLLSRSDITGIRNGMANTVGWNDPTGFISLDRTHMSWPGTNIGDFRGFVTGVFNGYLMHNTEITGLVGIGAVNKKRTFGEIVTGLIFNHAVGYDPADKKFFYVVGNHEGDLITGLIPIIQ